MDHRPATARRALTALTLACIWMLVTAHAALASESIPMTLRGKSIAIELYRPAADPPKGTVLMASGDVGWVGLAVDLARSLSSQGYAVVGINSRQYLSVFVEGAAHLTTDQIVGDYAAIVAMLRGRQSVWPPIVVAGVSEGAALAVVAGSGAANHSWVAGVITLGLPASAELAWRWKDAIRWVTKGDSSEPSFEPRAFIGAVAPLPLWMIQSTTDEYVTEADYRQLEAAARPPKRLVLIDAANHRFTNRLPQVREQVRAGVEWIQHPK
jgi:alpha-beta hydrolase superfamily lysophospholipase